MDSTDKDTKHNIMRQEAKIYIPRASGHMSEPTQPPNLPSLDLLHWTLENWQFRIRLYEASISCEWPTTKAILEERPELVRFAITENYDTALHIAASAEETKRMTDFVENLVNRMDTRDLELWNKNDNNPFCLAAAAGNVKMAKIMVNKNRALPDIPGTKGMMPLYMSALFGKHDMVRYLYDISSHMTGEFWTYENRGSVLLKCVEADMFGKYSITYFVCFSFSCCCVWTDLDRGFLLWSLNDCVDVAIRILGNRPEIAIAGNVCGDALRVLAENPNAFNRTEENTIWRIISSISAIIRLNVGVADQDNNALLLLIIIRGIIMRRPKFEIDLIYRGPQEGYYIDGKARYSSRPLFIAAEMGNTRFIVKLVRAYPDLICGRNDDDLTIFHMAVMHRHADIYNLLYEVGPMKQLIIQYTDQDGNNLLHLVRKTSEQMRHQAVSGASLVQRELLWFKEVEKMVPPSYRKRKNNDGPTPYALFSKNNKDLVSLGLKWMKDCLLIATFIVTVTFAIAFTIPGGYKQDNGIPMFIHKGAFLVFVIADAISLSSSSASLIVFLSIFTSRYNERDFFRSLPRRLMAGLATLFISVAAMMVAFGASFFVLYHNGLEWVPILISVLAAIPVLLFVVL